MRHTGMRAALLLLALVLGAALAQARAVEQQSASLSPETDGIDPVSFLELSSGWVHGVRRQRRFGSIRAERERLAQKQREDAIYAQNLKRLAARTQKWSAPSDAAMPHVLAETQARLHAAGRGGGGLMSAEEAQVESLLQVSAKPTLELHHINDVRSKLTADALHGRGLHNAANRRATAAGLAASPLNRPLAPAFTPLPPLAAASAPAPQPQAFGVSLLATAEQSRPSFMGPATAALPSQSVSAPTVLQSAPAPGSTLAPASSASSAAVAAADDASLEHEFVSGLPPAFMELDAATQLQILQLVDAGVDVAAEHKAKEQTKAQANSLDKAEAKAQKAKAQASEQPKAEAMAKPAPVAAAPAPTAAASESSATVGEDELASAARALNTLALLQKESHVPMNKLIRLLAANGKR